jgi:outer membrane protein insertion porin family
VRARVSIVRGKIVAKAQAWWQAAFCVWLTAGFAACAATNSVPSHPARLKISGYGILGNRELKRTLLTMETTKKPEFFDGNFVEDALLILTARIRRDGFLNSQITALLMLEDGHRLRVRAAELLENPLPHPLRIKVVEFRIRKGVLFYYKDLYFDGLETMTGKQARSYFIESASLLHLKRYQIYTPERLRQGINSLTDVLARQGYQDATVQTNVVTRDDRTGGVTVHIHVHQGKKSIVHTVREDVFYGKATQPTETRTLVLNRPYSRLWEQDFSQSLRTNQYQCGYPDTMVEIKTLERQVQTNSIRLELEADVKCGEQIRIGAVEFKGEKKTSKRLLARRVKVERGELLDPIRVDEGRYRLAQLGMFDTVDVSYQAVDEHVRKVIYQVNEGKRFRVSLLFGYGSYELLRGGFEAQLNNIWGEGHVATLRAIQSFKSSSGDFNYTIPELVGHDVDLFVNGSGLRREEVSFTREEYGGGLGVHKLFKSIATDVSTRYNYQILNTLDTFPAIATEGLTNPAVGSIITEIKLDRRDNPLYPRRGYKIFATFESATRDIGGDANFQRIELAPAWHFYLGGGRSVSFGGSHGVDFAFGSPANNLPFNRRFFPGGDNSIRGYNEGEASPRDARGKLVGAETYTLGTVEFEQALTPKLSLVVFSDNLGFAHRISDYPFDYGLFSVGGGLRYRTIVGPVRLEYGRNINPRLEDPSGAIHFSIGFPF